MKQLSPGCLLMAAGSGRRFHGNKLTALFEGKSLIRRCMESIPKELFSRVLVVTQYPPVAELAQAFSFEVLMNPEPELGISRTVCLGTEALWNCRGILYLVADQPLLRQETLVRIVSRWQEEPEAIVGPAAGGKRGNPNLFPRSLFRELCSLEGDRGGSAVIARHPELLRLVEVPARELADVDTRECLGALHGSGGQKI